MSCIGSDLGRSHVGFRWLWGRPGPPPHTSPRLSRENWAWFYSPTPSLLLIFLPTIRDSNYILRTEIFAIYFSSHVLCYATGCQRLKTTWQSSEKAESDVDPTGNRYNSILAVWTAMLCVISEKVTRCMTWKTKEAQIKILQLKEATMVMLIVQCPVYRP